MEAAIKSVSIFSSFLIKHRYFFGLAFILAMTSVAYYPGLSGPFTFDDISNILFKKEIFIKELSISKITAALTAQQPGPLGRPVAILSFIANYYLTGLNPFYFKLTNLLIHLFNGVGLFFLTRLLLQRYSLIQNNSISKNKIGTISLIVASVWLLHPLNLTSVLYVVQRMTSLSALFTILALICYIRGRDLLDEGNRKGFLIILLGTGSFGLLSIFSKENGVNLALYVLLTEIIFYRFTTHKNTQKIFKSLWLSAGILFLLAVLVLFLKNIDLFHLDSYQYRNFNLEERLLTEARVILFYIRLILLPSIREMGIYHDDIVISTGLLSPVSTLVSIIAIIITLIIAILIRKREPILTFGILWFFASHLLESTIIPLELVYEHRNYLAQYGLILGIFFLPFSNNYSFPKIARIKYPVIFVIIILLFSGTFFRADIWSSEWKLFNADAKYHPASPRAHTSLAIIYSDNKMFDEAAPHYQAAAELDECNIKTMTRLVQFDYIRNQSIKDELLVELQRRAVKCPYTYVSIWVFEGLLDNVSKDKKYQKRLLDIFEQMITRTDIKLQPDWATAAYSRAAIINSELGNYKKSLEFYELIFPLKPIAFHYLQTAAINVLLGELTRAYEVIQELEAKELVLSENDKVTLANLKKVFKHNNLNNTSSNP